MSAAAWIGIAMGAVLGSLLLYETALNAASRARRTQPRAVPAGGAPCPTCGTPGTLSILTTSSNEDSSSDLVMYCSRCGSRRGL
jgi:hypothetical protein